jgi:hypothetical protein
MNTTLQSGLGRWIGAAVMVAVMTGCQSRTDSAKVVASRPAMSMNVPANGATVVPAASPEVAPRRAAEAFLTAVTAEQTDKASAMLDVVLRKALFPPFYSDEQPLGYSAGDARKWLAQLAGGAKVFDIQTIVMSSSGHEASARGRWGERRLAMRLARNGDGWSVSAIIVTPATAEWHRETPPDGEAQWARETALDFLDAVCGGDARFASRVMTIELKRQLPSPSIPDSRELGYAEKDVLSWLAERGRGATGYRIKGLESTGAALTVRGEWIGMASTFTMKLTKDAAGTWRVDGLQ